MLFPVRCWTCGNVIGHLWEPFSIEVDKLKMSHSNPDSLKPIFNKLGLKRFCCCTIFLSHCDKSKKILSMGFPEDLN
ncbi:hypothetical protein BLOT_012659 [Blomia tropicalis]|nr:hypothetical protein BLOT_012659 [Blomia tropicalis]